MIFHRVINKFSPSEYTKSSPQIFIQLVHFDNYHIRGVGDDLGVDFDRRSQKCVSFRQNQVNFLVYGQDSKKKGWSVGKIKIILFDS